MTEDTFREKLAPMLVEDETIEWIGRPARLPRLYIRIFQIVATIAAIIVFFAFILPLLRGETIIMEGVPLTFEKAWPPTLLTVATLGGFAYLWMRQFRSVRYIVTNMRALIYMPVWGIRITYNFKKRKWERDYTDSEYSPITGGYFTAGTQVTRTGSQRYGTLTISNKRSYMDDAGTIRFIKRIFPFLDGIIFDPANLQFSEIARPKVAQKHIEGILDKHRPKDLQTP